jgi:hypothetical protein
MTLRPGTVNSTVFGRDQHALVNKLSPWWWLYNSDDPTPPTNYQPSKPEWLRTVMWYVRNPVHNFNFYIIGVADQDFTMRTRMVSSSLYWSVINKGRFVGVPVNLPFVEYSNKWLLFHIGWQRHGDFAIKLNILNSPVQIV